MAKFDITSLDPTKLKDWEIAEEAEKYMKPISVLADEWGIKKDELLPYGHFIGKVDFPLILDRL
ncbi:MAG: formate--tetrahydrofolate ligase, partial [Dehalococcoidales bacterium]|nr:formate--tetrahydrofolate ligase [Dehalococcoidales bacterium]